MSTILLYLSKTEDAGRLSAIEPLGQEGAQGGGMFGVGDPQAPAAALGAVIDGGGDSLAQEHESPIHRLATVAGRDAGMVRQIHAPEK